MNEHTSKWLTMLFPEFGCHPREGPLLFTDHIEIIVYNYLTIPLIYIYIYKCTTQPSHDWLLEYSSFTLLSFASSMFYYMTHSQLFI
jgi:hypothetical protein